ncbi:MAG: membrane dipeptidase [Pirellulaceae bacterium]|nr:membrane dipeptidase [Pirellulaceae bacterium]
MPAPLIIDLHLDLAWDALFWNRDLTLSAQEVRRQEKNEPPQVAADYNTGLCSVTFPEMRRGSVGIMLSTIMSRIEPRMGQPRRDGMRTQEQAMAVGRGHLAYYQAMARRGEIKPVLGLADLEAAVAAWRQPTETTPIYHILSMESADPIADPDDVAFWWEAGLRVVGPAHFGHNTYIHGTGTEGGLKPAAKPLYKALQEAGMILDITHMADQAVRESFDLWDGPIMASHCTCRSIVRGQRHLDDWMIHELIRRDGVIGLVFCQFFIDPGVVWENRPSRETWVSKYGMEGLLPHIEHIADLAGGSTANISIGTDMDGGFGAEVTPTDVNTIADLQEFAPLLHDAGYSDADVNGILHGNALRLLAKAWGGSWSICG